MPATSGANRAPSKSEVSSLLATGLHRAARKVGGRGTLADRMDTSPKTIDRALAGESIPEFHTVMSSLLADPTALDEVAGLYGVCIAPRKVEAANDMALAAGISNAVTEMLTRISDGKRCHIDTAALADVFRQIIPAMTAIVNEHDARKAGRAVG